MSRVFVIADLHFGHKKAAELRGFPSTEAHDDALVQAWTRVVTKRDVVYVLGVGFDGCMLTHIPVHPCQFGRYELNVHGHMHSAHIDDQRYIPVSVEHCARMEPLPLRELIEARRQGLAAAEAKR